jgi:hypothetical protein
MSDREARAAARRTRAVLRKAVLQRDEQDLSPITGVEAVSLVWRLTRESWQQAGRSEPVYGRRDIPVRFVPGRRA